MIATANGVSQARETDGTKTEITMQTEVANAHSVFSSMRTIPTLSYTMQNIFTSMGVLFVSFSGLIFTVTFVLPLSIVRAMVPKRLLTKVPSNVEMRKRGKVVMIVGASRGIGMEVLKQYVPEPHTTIIAVSKDREHLRDAVGRLGNTPATIHAETIDLAAPPKDVADSIENLDRKYGPISHLYAVSAISNHLKNETPFNLDIMEELIKVNVAGTVAVTMKMYELMKNRDFGKICIVGSAAGIYGPANMIGYSSTKAFINTFASCLRVLGSANNVEVVAVEPGFIDTRMTKMMRGQGSTVPNSNFAQAELMAARMKQAVEKGGVSHVGWPVGQSMQMNSFKGLNPICDDFGRWVSLQLGMAGKKIT